MKTFEQYFYLFMSNFSLYLLLAFTILTPKRKAETDWFHPNIVLQHGKWEPIPEWSNDPKPPLPYDNKHLKNDTLIIVLIASYRETRCKDTLYNIFTKSAHPKRIRIAIIQQNDETDEDCLYAYCLLMNKNPNLKTSDFNKNNCPYFSNIKIRRMHSSEAKGPVYARAQQVSISYSSTNAHNPVHNFCTNKVAFVDNEDFCMQIDAHSDVAQNWDILMLFEWGKCKNEFAILSTYPSNIKDINRNSNKHWEMPHLCEASILGNGQVRNGRAKAAANLKYPIIAPLWAAGLSFSRCHAEKRVPNDPHLKHVFNGEEFSRGSRLWTNGYDFYSPTRAYIGTYYQQEKGSKGSWRVNHGELQVSNRRMATLLMFPNSDQSDEAVNALGFYGLGSVRTFEQYVNFSGVNTMLRKVDMGDKCIRKWVAFDDSGIKPVIVAMNEHRNQSEEEIVSEVKVNVVKVQMEDENVNGYFDNWFVSGVDGWSNRSVFGLCVFCMAFVCVIVGYFRYRRSIRKVFYKHKMSWKAEEHIV